MSAPSHKRTYSDPLEDQESGQGGQRDAGSLGLEKDPDKTFIGRNETGFDFLGYHFGPAGLSVAKKTIEIFVARATQAGRMPKPPPAPARKAGWHVRQNSRRSS